MNYLSAESLSKSYNEKWLFRDISVGIDQGQKVALVGINGSGKTTLLNILAGMVKPDGGKVVVNKDIRIGYLNQDPDFQAGHSIHDTLFSADNESLNAIREYNKCLNDPALHDGLQKAMEKMDQYNAWDYEETVKQVISKMGLTDLDKKVEMLSGGQKKRVAMARVLIDNPDFLIMDEPTNHLDLETIEWLENFLSTKNTTILLVTHDRYFLDKVATLIYELDQGTIFKYNGNYSYFLEKKEQREMQQLAEIDKAKNTLRKELAWMRRQPKARGTKSKSRIDAFYDLQEKATSLKTGPKLELNVQTSRQGGKIIEVEHISKAYDGKKFIDDFTYVFKKKDRIGIVGKNGIGKSTLLNILTGKSSPDSGRAVKGETTVVGYFSQDGLKLKDDQRVIEVVKEIAEFITMGDGTTISASKFLEYFQFTPALQYTFVSKLSGGERKRLQLLKILILNPNFLILDEPTNDLDLVTLAILEDFLMNYPGCLLIVSHDRFFMDQLVEHLFVFEGEGKIRNFPGNYTEYREWVDEREKAEEAKARKQINIAPEEKKQSGKISFNEKREYEILEKEIADLEMWKNTLITKLNEPNLSHKELAKVSEEIAQTTDSIEAKTERWMELGEKI